MTTKRAKSKNEQIDWQSVGDLASRINLIDIQLLKFSAAYASGVMVPHNGPVRVDIGFRTSHFISDDALVMDVRVQSDLRGIPEGWEDGRHLYEVSVDLVVRYELRGRGKVSSETAQAFAASNGVFNAWPFIRECFYNGTSRLRASPVVLPTTTLPQLRERTPGMAKPKT